jgi:hypothetical protein
MVLMILIGCKVMLINMYASTQWFIVVPSYIVFCILCGQKDSGNANISFAWMAVPVIVILLAFSFQYVNAAFFKTDLKTHYLHGTESTLRKVVVAIGAVVAVFYSVGVMRTGF